MRLARKTARSEPVRIVRNEVSTPAGPPPQAVWAAWGAWYEQAGDYDRAALAFRQAETVAGDKAPVIYTYEAGRAAECAGDVSTAVEYYSKMLSRSPGAKPQPDAEKGVQKWTPLENAASLALYSQPAPAVRQAS